MKKRINNNLKEELRIAGADDSEINELASLASSLKRLKNPSSSAKPRLEKWAHNKWARWMPIGLTSITGLALGMAIVIFSQTVLPGSVLYPVQKLSDHVAVSLDPQYRGDVMMKRAEQVKQLVTMNANSSLVLATLSDYQVEASAYKTVSTNYAAYEYCKVSLQQAALNAPTSERSDINNALMSLNNV